MGTLLLVVTSVSVEAIPLLDLMDGRSIQVGDKVFSDWRAVSSQKMDYSKIHVLGDSADAMNPGLIFADELNQIGVSTSDIFSLEIIYSVSVIDRSKQIKDTSLMLGDYYFEGLDKGGTIKIAEDIFNFSNNLLCVRSPCQSVMVDTRGGGNTTDGINFEPQDMIWVDTNILIESPVPAGFSRFAQYFSQISRNGAVPEPETALLIGLGLAGLMFGRRRANTGNVMRA